MYMYITIVDNSTRRLYLRYTYNHLFLVLSWNQLANKLNAECMQSKNISFVAFMLIVIVWWVHSEGAQLAIADKVLLNHHTLHVHVDFTVLF